MSVGPSSHRPSSGGSGTLSASSGGVTVLPSSSKNAFAFTIGGGLDVKATQHVAIRLIQAEYFYTNFTAPSGSGVSVPHQNNARLTFGLVFRF
jgi:opacity protein-like surface antigen